MLLAEADMALLERAGFHRKDFARHDRKSFARLRNSRGHCVFYDVGKRRCKVYRVRPSGCRIYPVIFSEEEGVVVDDFCPLKDTVTRREVFRKGKVLVKLLETIDREAQTHSLRRK